MLPGEKARGFLNIYDLNSEEILKTQILILDDITPFTDRYKTNGLGIFTDQPVGVSIKSLSNFIIELGVDARIVMEIVKHEYFILIGNRAFPIGDYPQKVCQTVKRTDSGGEVGNCGVE